MDTIGDLNNAGSAEGQPMPEDSPIPSPSPTKVGEGGKPANPKQICGRSKRLIVIMALIVAVSVMYLATGIIGGFGNITEAGYAFFGSLVVVITALANAHTATEAASRAPKE